MITYTVVELKELLLKYYDADELLDVLSIEAEDLLDRFEDRLDRFNTSELPNPIQDSIEAYEDDSSEDQSY